MRPGPNVYYSLLRAIDEGKSAMGNVRAMRRAALCGALSVALLAGCGAAAEPAAQSEQPAQEVQQQATLGAQVADAFKAVLANPSSIDFAAEGDALKYCYALVNMNEDGIPELLLARQANETDWFCRVLTFEQSVGQAVLVGEPFRYTTSSEALYNAKDMHGLARATVVGEQLVVEELRIQEGQLAVAQVGSFAVAEPPQPGEATGSAITFLDATDIRPVECLRQMG